MSGWLSQFTTFFKGLDPTRRTVLVAAVAVTMAIMVAVGWWSWSDQYQEVYTSADPADVEEFAAELERQGIHGVISSSGRSVSVLAADEGRARVAGASVGKEVGFEALSDIDIGTSPQRERWAYQRALQGELARTISSLIEIQSARVHLVLPERTVFLRDQSSASGSVTLRMRPGAVLTDSQVRGITAMVAGAVNGLASNDVVLVDQSGHLIAGGETEEGGIAGMPTLLELRKVEEARTRRTVMDSLTRVFGSPDDVSVGVTVDLETRSVDRTTRSRDPDSQVVISETVREQSSSNSQQGGVPGTQSNLPEQTPSSSSTGSTNQDTSEQRSNYAYTQVEEREVRSAGSVKRVSVGVVINADRVEALVSSMVGEGASEADTGQARQELQQHIEDTVRMAMGFDESRGDKLVVTFLPFTDGAVEPSEVASSFSLSEYRWAVPFLVALVGLGLVFVIVVRPLMKMVARGAQGGRQLTDAEGGQGAVARPADEDNPEAERIAQFRDLADRMKNMVDNFEGVNAEDLNRLVSLESQSTARVLRRWIREG